MRAVLQRVTHAEVQVDGNVVGSIGSGLMVLLGVAVGDTREQCLWMAKKISSMRIFNDSEGVMNKSILDVGGDVLAVSQFTLMASTKKGNRPSYVNAAKGEIAKPLYECFCNIIEEILHRPVKRGIFGADMKVELANDGPVTIILDSESV